MSGCLLAFVIAYAYCRGVDRLGKKLTLRSTKIIDSSMLYLYKSDLALHHGLCDFT